MAKKPQKGVAGKNTGGTARKVIRSKLKAGATIKQIARAGMRDPSTINGIKNGDIKNPPANLAGKMRKTKATKKKARR